MKSLFTLTLLFVLAIPSVPRCVAAPKSTVLLEERFEAELSKDWFWGLGTWTSKDGVLRGYESGPRRHGPVMMRKFPLGDGIVECGVRLERGATFAGIIFNGSQERGHVVHVVMGKDALRILVHPRKGESVELINQPNKLAIGTWHRLRIEFNGPHVMAKIDDTTIITASHECIAEGKLSFGLGGDSGGPEGERVGALEFRALQISK